MSKVQDKYRGCLLGLAAGDAMGLTVDNKSWEQIQESYGPNGLLGYDLQEDFAEITASFSPVLIVLPSHFIVHPPNL